MTTGTVKWFNSTKGFGFIQPDNGGAEAFVHISAVERAGMREIVEGQKIGYDMSATISRAKCRPAIFRLLKRYLLFFDHGCTGTVESMITAKVRQIAWPFFGRLVCQLSETQWLTHKADLASRQK